MDESVPKLVDRAITPRLMASLADTPAVMLVGPRQAGKSTLVQGLAAGPHPARYLTLDDLGTLDAARRDPVGLIESADGAALVIDEIQRAPDLLLPIKAAIDRNRRPGRFVLTGSAQVMLLPKVSESLAGRVEIHTLWPFSQAEIEDIPGRIVESLLDGPPPASAPAIAREELIARMARGGFPEAAARGPERREEWLAAYLTAVVQRDLRDLANIERLSEVPAVLASLAARVRAPLNKSDVSSSVGIPRTSLDRYLALLEHVFLVRRLPAWHTNRIKQVTKSPKLLLSDSALLMHLLRVDRRRLASDDSLLGTIVECFVGMELTKQISASAARASLLHLRTAKGAEVDFILESVDGRVAAIEVKASATVRGEDFKHLATLRDRLGKERFVRGVVLYAGGERLPFGERLEAWPLTSLWVSPR